MSVKYVLSQAGSKMGLSPSDAEARSVLIRFLNEAGRELYAQSDMAGSLVEQAFKVNGDQTISCPMYVGRIRAARELASQMSWHINQLRPRYNQFPWTDMWRNLRLKNKQCLMSGIVNQSQVTITVPEIETAPVTVSITGQTQNATSISEQFVMDSLTKTTTNAFLDITSVKKDKVNSFDVTIQDADGRTLTVIPNNMLSSQYQIIDVSSCPWLPQNTSPQDNYLEILYKQTLPYLSNDDDEFPGFDYDDIIVNKMMQLWKEEQDKVEAAAAYDSKATRSLARLHEEQNRATEDMVALVANPHDTMLRRIGTGLRRRYRMFGGRRW